MSPTVATIPPPTAPVITPLQRIIVAVAEGKTPDALDVDQIDECIAEYEQSEASLAATKARHEERKEALTAYVGAHGTVPPHAEQSKRVLGRRNQATVTTGTTTTVDEDAVLKLAKFLAAKNKGILFGQLFTAETKHKLVKGAGKAIAAFALPKRVHEKVLSLFGRCFDVDSKAPVLKVSVIEPEKPPRKARDGKAVA